MANPIIRRVVGIFAGVVVAGLTVAVLESLGHLLFPPPPGLDITSPADQARLMEVVPLGAKLAVIVAWFLGALAGAWIAVRISRWSPSAWVIAAVMTVLSIPTTQMFPNPLWMVALALVLPGFAAWLVQARGTAN
jgi:predicted naringenin-chalcone synthase